MLHSVLRRSSVAVRPATFVPRSFSITSRSYDKDNGAKPKPKPPTPKKVPLNFGLVLFPAFQALDVFGPLDALNLLSAQHPLNLSIIANTTAPVTTRPQSAAMLLANSDFQQKVVPTHTFSTAPKDLEVLIVPGGLGTRNPNTMPFVVNYVREAFPNLRYILSVCTGAGILARAGVLDGKKATTNKAAWADTTKHGPKTKWIKKARWVEDGRVWTSAGVSAGTDMILAWIDEVYGWKPEVDPVVGKKEKYGEYVGRIMEYNRVSDWREDPWAEIYFEDL